MKRRQINKSILISHVDLDGCGPVILSKYFNIQFDDIHMFDYEWETKYPEKLEDILYTYNIIVFADHSPSEVFFEKYKEIDKKNRIIVYDHHQSSEWLVDLKDDEISMNLYHDKTMSGTKNFFLNHIKPIVGRHRIIISDLVELIDTYDMWKDEDSLWDVALSLNRLLYKMNDWNYRGDNPAYQFRYFIDAMIKKLKTMDEWEWKPYELNYIVDVIEKEEYYYNQFLEQKKERTDSKGRKFFIGTLGGKISIVCSRVLKDFPDIDYIVIVNNFRQLNNKLSLRTRKELDLPNMFKEVEGHPKAAGGAMDSIEDIQKLLSGEIHELTYLD